MLKLKQVGAANFASEVLEANQPVIVDFSADWCPPCRALAPVLEKFAAETPGVKVVKVDVDDDQALAQKYGVDAIPLLAVFRQGQVVRTHQGAASASKLKSLVDAA